MTTCSIRFQPGDRNVEVRKGTPLTVVAAEAGFLLRSDCGGAGTCGKCKVYIGGKEQLACRTMVEEDLELTIPETSLRPDDRQVIVQDRSFFTQSPETTRSPLRSGQFGLALDIGTTTLVAELFEYCPAAQSLQSSQHSHCHKSEIRLLGVASRANPQRAFGDDVIARIQKIIEEPAFLKIMHETLIEAVDAMIVELAERSVVICHPAEISVLSLAGNTVMEHLFFGIDPSPLGFAPFTPPLMEFPCCRAGELGIRSAPEAMVEALPIFGGFVGGDIVAGVLATDLAKSDKTQFLIDIGTNGELVLAHDGELYTAATAAGPAFEGARIEYGCLAVPGAIDHVELREDGNIFVSTIGNKTPIGLCGSGLIDLCSEMLRHGLIKPTGQFDVRANSPFINRWKTIDGKPALAIVANHDGNENGGILLLQRDVRQLQLAAGAIRAGIQLLLRRLQLQEKDVDTFFVGGGFGSFIRPESARRIGLLPSDVPLERIKFCGNSSLAGAQLALFDPRYAEQAREFAHHRVHHLDLSSLPDFATVFAESMIFSSE